MVYNVKLINCIVLSSIFILFFFTIISFGKIKKENDIYFCNNNKQLVATGTLSKNKSFKTEQLSLPTTATCSNFN